VKTMRLCHCNGLEANFSAFLVLLFDFQSRDLQLGPHELPIGHFPDIVDSCHFVAPESLGSTEHWMLRLRKYFNLSAHFNARSRPCVRGEVRFPCGLPACTPRRAR